MLNLSNIDLEEIANALAGRTGDEHYWLINPDTGEIAFWRRRVHLAAPSP